MTTHTHTSGETQFQTVVLEDGTPDFILGTIEDGKFRSFVTLLTERSADFHLAYDTNGKSLEIAIYNGNRDAGISIPVSSKSLRDLGEKLIALATDSGPKQPQITLSAGTEMGQACLAKMATTVCNVDRKAILQYTLRSISGMAEQDSALADFAAVFVDGFHKLPPVESTLPTDLDKEYEIWITQVDQWLEDRPYDPCSSGPLDELENLIDVITEKLKVATDVYNNGGVLPAGAARSLK
jgi:hypothetical protein